MASSTFGVLLLLSFPLIVLSSPLLSLPVDGTACEWNVWDDTTERKSIQKISIRCTEGQVTWRTPYGGLAIDFLPLLKLQHFELCFVAQSSFATLQLFIDENRSLSRLAALNSSKLSRTPEICLRSSGNKPLVIFIETDSSSSSPVYGKMVLEYDIQVLPETNSTLMQECRPCSDEETVMSVCTSDYAVFGEIHSVTKSNESGLTELNVIANHVVRQRFRVVKDLFDVRNMGNQQTLTQHLRQNRDSLHATERSSFSKRHSMTDVLGNGKENIYNLSIVVPSKCQIRYGNGIFLFLGSIRLKRARLGCAPRLEEFRRIWDTALVTGSNPCVL